MRSSSSRSSVLGEMIQIICHIFLFIICTKVLSGDKSRSSVLVPVGPYNSSFFISRRFLLYHKSFYFERYCRVVYFCRRGGTLSVDNKGIIFRVKWRVDNKMKVCCQGPPVRSC